MLERGERERHGNTMERSFNRKGVGSTSLVPLSISRSPLSGILQPLIRRNIPYICTMFFEIWLGTRRAVTHPLVSFCRLPFPTDPTRPARVRQPRDRDDNRRHPAAQPVRQLRADGCPGSRHRIGSSNFQNRYDRCACCVRPSDNFVGSK